MSVPISEGWFSLSLRRNRKSFIGANLLLFLVLAAVFSTLGFFDARGTVGVGLFYLFFVPFMVAYHLLIAQRLRDMNITGWLALLGPLTGSLPEQIAGGLGLIFVLILCAVPGTQGKNRYGEDPLE